ncbi:MAG: hypothetical protein ACRDBG_04495 [Waterburya sp.]
MELGFSSVSRQPRIIYIAKERGSLWHFWSTKKQDIEPIKATSIAGYLRNLEVVPTTSEKYGTSDKLQIHLDVGDRNYILQSGISSWFAKSLIRNLGCLSREQLLKWIAIEPYSTDNTSKVIFSRVYDSHNRQIYSVDKYPYEKDSKGNSIDTLDYRKIIAEIQSRLPAIAVDDFSSFAESTETTDDAPSQAVLVDRSTGEVIGEDATAEFDSAVSAVRGEYDLDGIPF